MANHIAEVAQMLGVEIGEAFKIADDAFGKHPRYYRFTESTGIEMSKDGVEWKMGKAVVLKCLLLDEVRIIKLSWKPAMHDEYYYPSPSNRDLWGCGIWVNNNDDIRRLKHCLVFKTKEEAAAAAEKMLAVVQE